MSLDRFRYSFSPATVASLERLGAKLQVRQPLFFHTAYTASVIENERRSFSPVVALDAAKVTSARCRCAPAMKQIDFCRHIAALVSGSVGESEKFVESVGK